MVFSSESGRMKPFIFLATPLTVKVSGDSYLMWNGLFQLNGVILVQLFSLTHGKDELISWWYFIIFHSRWVNKKRKEMRYRVHLLWGSFTYIPKYPFYNFDILQLILLILIYSISAHWYGMGTQGSSVFSPPAQCISVGVQCAKSDTVKAKRWCNQCQTMQNCILVFLPLTIINSLNSLKVAHLVVFWHTNFPYHNQAWYWHCNWLYGMQLTVSCNKRLEIINHYIKNKYGYVNLPLPYHFVYVMSCCFPCQQRKATMVSYAVR